MDKNTLPSSINFSILSNTYSITFPNNGEFRRIQTLKTRLIPDVDALERGGAEGSLALTIAEVQSFLRVMCPRMVSDMTVEFDDLPLSTMIEIITAYNEQIRPWYQGWLSLLFSPKNES